MDGAVNRRQPYLVAVTVVAVTTAIRWAADPWLGDSLPLLIQALGIVVVGWLAGARAALLATVLALPLAWYLFIPDRWSFRLADWASTVKMAAFLIVGVVMALLSGRMQRLIHSSRQNAELLRRTLRDAPFPMMLHNEDGKVIELNEAWMHTTGYSRSELSTITDWTDRAYGERAEEVRRMIRELYGIDSARDSGERNIRTAWGDVRIWSFRSSPMGRDTDGRRLVLTAASDVTERAVSNQKLQATIDSITDGLMVLDRDWRCRYCSGTGARMLGVRSEDLTGRVLWDLFPASRNRKFYSEYQRAMLTREPVHFEEFYPAPLDRWFECHCYPSAEGLSVYFRDVSERKAVEQRLRDRTAELDSLLENAPIGFAFFDREFRYVRINERLAAINGLPVEAHLGRKIRDVLPLTAAAVESEVERVFSTAEPIITEITGETPDQPGIRRTWHTGFYPVSSENGVTSVGAFVIETTEKRRAEQALRESTDRLELALRSANMGTFDIAIPRAELAWDTRSFVLFGVDPHTGITLESAMATVHAEDRDRVATAIRAACDPDSGGNYQAEYRIHRPDGSLRWMLSTGRVLFEDRQPVRLAGINHDVTERKQAELALKESQERFGIAAAAAELGVFEWDAETDEIFLHNERMHEILGTEAASSGMKLSSFFNQGDERSFRSAVNTSLASSGPLRTTVRIRHKDGDRWVRLEGTFRSPSRLLAIAHDITEARRLEQALERNQAYLSAVIEGLPVGVGTTDRQGKILSMNEAGLRLHGFRSFDEMLSSTYEDQFELLYPDRTRMPSSEWPFAKAVRGEYVTDYEVILRNLRAGTEFTVSYTTVPVRSDGDLVICAIQDITARRASEAQYRTLFESIDEGFCVIEMYFDEHGKPTDYSFLEANPAFERHTGLKDAVGRSVNQLVPNLDESWFQIYGQVALSREPVRFENDAPAMGRSFDVYAFPIGAPEQRRVALLFNDITVRKQNERAVLAARQEAESQRRLLDAVLESLPVGVIIADASGRLVRWNRASTALWGLDGLAPETAAGVEGFHHWSGWWPETGRQVEPHEWAMSRALSKGEVTAGELVEIERFDGGGRRFMVNMGAPVRDDAGNVIGAVVAQTDVTDRFRMERDLRESEDKFRTISDNIPQIAWMADSSGQTLWHNRRWVEYTGLSVAGERIPFTAVLHPDDAALVKSRWEHSLKTGEQFDAEFRCRRHDGTYEWFLGRAIAIRDRDGNVVRWFGTDTGIQQQKVTEAALRRSNEDLQQFAYVASHDLQEPLRTVVSFGKLLTRRYSEQIDEDGREMIAFMSDAALRMSALVRDLLLYSRVTRDSEQPRERVDLSHVIEQVVTDLHSAIEDAGATVESGHLPVVHGNRMQLGQVFQNLISNALKYRREGVPTLVRIGCEQRRGEWVVSVADNGQGFPQEFADRIFGIFKRLHNTKVPGTGIGLAICRTVIERHGGTIWAESNEGSGATFYFTLPAA